jgi:ankyrin repeat protein
MLLTQALSSNNLSLHVMSLDGREETLMGHEKEKRNHKNDSNSNRDIFFVAVEEGNEDKVRDLVSKDLVNLSHRGAYPIHTAVKQQHKGIVQLLLEHGADVNVLDDIDRTALHISCALGAKDISVMLLGSGAFANQRDRNGTSPLHIAVVNHYFDLANDILLFGGDINFKKVDGTTMLHDVVNKGDMDALTFLLTKDPHLNIKDSLGEVPLFKAIKRDDVCAIKLLCQNSKLKLSVWNSFNQNIFHLAAKFNAIDTTRHLIKLLNGKTDEYVNQQDSLKKYTPLHFAVLHPKILEIMLEVPCDVNAKDQDGNTPLHLALKEKKEDVVKLLINKGSKLDIKNSQGETPKKLAEKVNIQVGKKFSFTNLFN